MRMQIPVASNDPNEIATIMQKGNIGGEVLWVRRQWLSTPMEFWKRVMVCLTHQLRGEHEEDGVSNRGRKKMLFTVPPKNGGRKRMRFTFPPGKPFAPKGAFFHELSVYRRQPYDLYLEYPSQDVLASMASSFNLSKVEGNLYIWVGQGIGRVAIEDGVACAWLECNVVQKNEMEDEDGVHDEDRIDNDDEHPMEDKLSHGIAFGKRDKECPIWLWSDHSCICSKHRK